MNRVLVLGGYGGFGARLSRRLAADGWTVIVAGRDLDKARRFAARLDRARAARADRNGDLAPVLAETHPDLLIDAAGPFQDSDTRVPQACIAAGVHYADLADAREFVCGIGALDEAAKAAGVAVVAGCSTLPALSSAVLAELTGGMDRVERVEMALSASSKTTSSRSVVGAVLSYAGQAIPLWRGQRRDLGIGGQERRRVRFAIPGARPLTRSVVLADVPDHALLPERLPGRPATVFRAGNDMRLQAIVLGWMASLVRWRVLASLRPFTGPLAAIQRWLSRIGSDRSAMAVEARGWRRGEGLSRRWTVLAEQGSGPEIPVLAAQLLARKLRDGTLASGARDAGGLFTLAEFRALFEPLAIDDDIVQTSCVPLYARAMGERYTRLPEPVRSVHAIVGDGGATGEGEVERGSNLLARLVGAIMRFPPAGTHPVHVSFALRDGREVWTRRFGPHRFHSELSLAGDGVAERFGPLRFTFALPSDDTGLRMELRHWTAFGIPLPRFLAPRIAASERAEGDDFLFDVAIALPLIGPLVHYRGRLRPL